MLNLVTIRKYAKNDQFIISSHARMRMFQRNILTNEIIDVLLTGDIIEEDPEDKPCPSALILGFLENDPYHVVVGQCDDHLRIITVYRPNEKNWIDFRARKRSGE